MEAVTLQAKERANTGKGYTRRLRKSGSVPAVVYGKELGSQALEVSAKEVEKLLNTYGGNALVKLQVAGKEHDTLVREVQRHPIRGDVIHVDFQQISLKEKLQTVVPVHLTGEAQGVRDGGILQHGLREVEVECLPTDIPDYIEVDISDLKIGDTITVADLQAGKNVEILSEANSVIATIVAPRMGEEKETEEIGDGEVAVEESPEGAETEEE